MTTGVADPWVAKRPRTPRYHEPSDLELRHTPVLLGTKLSRGWPTAEYATEARRDYEQALMQYHLWWEESWQAFRDDMQRLGAEAQREMDLVTGTTRTETERRPRTYEQATNWAAEIPPEDAQAHEPETDPDEEARPIGKNRSVYNEDRGWVDTDPVDPDGDEMTEEPTQSSVTVAEYSHLASGEARRKVLASVHNRHSSSTEVARRNDAPVRVVNEAAITGILQPAATPLDRTAEWLYNLGERYRRWRATKRA